MRITVVGPGAVGGAVGGTLAIAGAAVDVVARPGPHLDALRRHGVRLEGVRGPATARFSAVRTPADELGRLELVLLAVKAPQTEAACALIARHLGPSGVVVPLQNGLCVEIAGRMLGRERVLPAMVHLPAQRPAPGRVVRSAEGDLYLGEWDGAMTARLEAVRAALAPAIRVHATPDVWGFIWAKLAFACMQCGQALVNATTREVLAQAWTGPVLLGVMAEVRAAARAAGIATVRYDDVAPGTLPAGSDRLNVYGRDLVAGVPGEIDVVCGAVARVGREHALAMPLCERIVELTHEIEAGRRAMGWENLRDLERLVPA